MIRRARGAGAESSGAQRQADVTAGGRPAGRHRTARLKAGCPAWAPSASGKITASLHSFPRAAVMSRNFLRIACAAALVIPALSAHAEIVIGVDVSTTGPAAAIGIQTNNAIRLWPNTLGGEPARYVVLDDGTDVSRAVKNMRKLTSEDKVDAIVGPNTTAAALAALDVLAETKTPMIAL